MPELDVLRSDHDRLHSRRADLVDRGGIGALRKASTKRYLTSWALADACRDDIAKVDLVDKLRLDLAALESSLDRDDTQLRSGQGLQCALEGSNWSAGGRNDHDLVGAGKRLQRG